MGRSAMMTGAQTCVKMLNPAVNQTTLPYGMTRMGLNPAEERKRTEREIRRGRKNMQTEGESCWREREGMVIDLFKKCMPSY